MFCFLGFAIASSYGTPALGVETIGLPVLTGANSLLALSLRK